MPLFDQKIRTLQGPAIGNFDQYTYYNESARPEIANIRDLLESWYTPYPESDKVDLKQRLRVAFAPTFFEIYIFALFHHLGYKLEPHPIMPGTPKHPDYRASKGTDSFILEVKQLSIGSETVLALERRTNTLREAIEKVDASNFLISIHKILFKSNEQPRGKTIIKEISDKLKDLDPDQLSRDGVSISLLTYEDDKVYISYQPMPKAPKYRGTKSRAIGVIHGELQIGNDSETIRGAVQGKALRYGTIDTPYIVCINKQSVYLDQIEVNEAWYGDLAATHSTTPQNKNHRLQFMGNGAFGNQNNPKLTRLSGVYVTNCNTANLSSTAEHVLKQNLYAQRPCNSELKIINEKKIKQILNIPDGYPYLT